MHAGQMVDVWRATPALASAPQAAGQAARECAASATPRHSAAVTPRDGRENAKSAVLANVAQAILGTRLVDEQELERFLYWSSLPRPV